MIAIDNANAMFARREIHSALSRWQQFEAQGVRTVTQHGRTLVTVPTSGQVEVFVVVDFWNPYTDEPAFYPSGVLAPDQKLVQGSFPQWSGTVAKWVQPDQISGSNAIQPYLGAQLAYVVSGPVGMKLYVTYSFIGNALMIPGAGGTPSNGTGNA